MGGRAASRARCRTSGTESLRRFRLRLGLLLVLLVLLLLLLPLLLLVLQYRRAGR